MDIFQKSIIDDSIIHLDDLLGSGILKSENWRNPLFKSAFLDVIVTLRNLMGQMEKINLRIDFDDDVIKTEKIRDVTHLVINIRGAFCHPDSFKNYYKHNNSAKIVSFFNISNEKDGDLCFYFGPQKIYLKRHIVRAIEEAKEKLNYEKRISPQEILDSLKENKD